MALQKIAAFGKCIMTCEQIATQAFKQILITDNCDAVVGWLHRTTHTNNWEELGLNPEIELVGSGFLRTAHDVEVFHAKVSVHLSQSESSIIDRYTRKYPKEYDVDSVSITLRCDVGSKKMEFAHRFAFKPFGQCAHPVEEFRLILLP